MKRVTGILVLALALTAGPALAEDVIVLANGWGAQQDAAVSSAGGTIAWKHQPTGLGLVRSPEAGLYERLQASGAFRLAARDVVLDWQPGVRVAEESVVDDAVTPGDDARYSIQWAHQAVDTAGAWAAGCEGAGARVAILDGGLYDLHDDLDAPGKIDAACSMNFTGQGTWNSDIGTFWHGTHVASIVAGEDNTVSGLGIAPAATLVGVKVLHNGSGAFSGILAGILYAANPAMFGKPECARADIINMSLGVPEGVLRREAASHGEGQNFLAYITKVFNYAASQGVLHVGSAGNDAIDYGQAANLVVVPNQLSRGVVVSATAPSAWAYGNTDYDTPSSYTSFGEDLVFVSAPGGDFDYPGNEDCTVGGLVRPCWVFDMYIAACRGSGASETSSCWAAGTSMASPVAAGVAALMKGANPALNPAQLRALLKNSADDAGAVGKDQFHGHGFVNAAAACAAAKAR
jgi:subtilisin family serine protease